MILSSADILRILGGSEIIRLSAKLKVVDGKPALSGAEGLFIFINRFPRLEEFEATWTIWIESDGSEPDDLVVAEIQKLLPKVQVRPGLMTEVTTTDFRSESTQSAPEAPKAKTAQVDLSQYEERFQALVEDVQDQMLLVTSGRAGTDGRDGRDGVDGRDGRDLVATDADLEDLQNVEEGIAKERGQVLTWDGTKWTNLFVPQVYSAGGATDGGGTVTPNDAVSATVQWKFDNAQLTDPLSDGSFHTDSLDGELVTKIRVSHLTGRNNDITVLINDLLTQGYDRLYVAQSDDLSQAQLYLITGFTSVTDGTELTVAHLVTAGIEPNFQNNKNYEFYISQSAGAGTINAAGGGGSSLWTQSGSDIYYSTGKVSIGTDTPVTSDALHLRGGAGSVTWPLQRFSYPAASVPLYDPVAQLSFSDNAGATAAAIIVRNNEGNWTAGTAHPCDIEFYATPQFSNVAVERFTITGDGEVYVGDYSSKKVKVKDDGKVVLNTAFLPLYPTPTDAIIGGEEEGTVCVDGAGYLFIAKIVG
jgi:hypothetical protein